MSAMDRRSSVVSVLVFGVLWLWSDRCESLTDSSLSQIFYPFGRDEGDKVVTVGDDNCDGPINIPFNVFHSPRLFVSHNKLLYYMSTESH